MLRVGEASQVYRLREKLEAAGVGHAQEVVADIPNLRVTSNEVFFCYIPTVAVAALSGEADGQEMPKQAVLQGFGDLPDGFYDLKKARIVTNGRIAITRLPETELIPVPA